MRGEMLWFDEKKDFGFILTEDGERLYVDRAGFLPGDAPVGRCAHMKVAFEREGGSNGTPHAVGVTLVEDEAPRRARMRRQHGAR